MTGAPSLEDLWRMAVMHHGALKGFAGAHAGRWNIAARRTAWQGLAVLASMIRRLIHLMAREVAIAPARLREDPLPRLAPRAPRRPSLRFRLIETPRERPPRPSNPDRVPDKPEFNHALFLDRLSVLAAVYRSRERRARRLARRIQAGRAPLRALPLPPRLYPRVPPGLTEVLHHLNQRLALPDTS